MLRGLRGGGSTIRGRHAERRRHGFFFFTEKFTSTMSAWCYIVCQPPGGGEGPARGARAPVPAGRCGGGAARGASPGFRACRGAGGAWRSALVGGQGGLGSRLCVRAGRGHTGAWYTYNTYTVPGAGVGTRVPWPPVLAVLGGGVAVRHGRPLSAGRGAQGGAPAEEGGGTVHRHCMRCRPLPASPGPGRRCSPDRPGVVGRPRCLPAQGSVPSG